MIDPKYFFINTNTYPESYIVGGWDRGGGGWTFTVTSAALNTTDPEV